jgi:phage FluMu protein Com
MCFRPTQIAKPVECPQCGKKIAPLNCLLPKKCPFCGYVTGASTPGNSATDEKK